MNIIKKMSITKYFLVLIASLLIVKFIFNGGLVLLNSAFRPFFVALMIIYLLNPIADFLHRKTKLNRKGSVIVSYIGLLVGFGLFVLMIVPSMVSSISTLVENLGQYDESQFIDFLTSIPMLSDYVDVSSIENILAELETFVVSYSSDILNYSTNILASIGSAIWAFVMVIMALIMAFFALKDSDHIGEKIEDLFMAFLPDDLAKKIIRILTLTDKSVKKYLVSKVYTCIILGILVFVGIVLINLFTPLHIPYAPLVAFLIGFSNMIPYAGVFIAIPAVLLGLMAGLGEGIALLAWVLITAQIDNLIVSPKVVGNQVGVKPFWIIVSITVGGSLFGAIGMIISVPIISVVLKLVDEIVTKYKEDKKTLENINEDDAIEVPED